MNTKGHSFTNQHADPSLAERRRAQPRPVQSTVTCASGYRTASVNQGVDIFARRREREKREGEEGRGREREKKAGKKERGRKRKERGEGGKGKERGRGEEGEKREGEEEKRNRRREEERRERKK